MATPIRDFCHCRLTCALRILGHRGNDYSMDNNTTGGGGVRMRRLIEQLAAEIGTAKAAGDKDRVRKLADLQADVVAQMSREVIAEITIPRPRLAS
jgi:hypothetical protein